MARKRAPFIQDYFSGNRKVVHLFPLRSMLEAKAFLLSPVLPGDVISLKHTKSGPPAKPGACVIPERASYRQASQEALKKSAACITCPAARKRAPFIQDYLPGNRKVVHLFPLRSMLEAKAFLLSPADQGVVISLKHTKQAGRGGNSSQHPRAACGRKKGSCASKEYLS